MTLRGIGIGDLHLDKMRKHFPDQDIDLQLAEVAKVFRYAKRQGIEHVFFLGDVGEGYSDFTSMLRMSEKAQAALFRMLKSVDGSFNVYILIGNHDFSGLDSHTLLMFFELQRQGVFKTVRFFDQQEQLKIDGVPVCILPYPYTKPKTSRPSLCFAHYEVKGAVRDNGRKITAGEKHRYEGHVFVQGHLHTQQVVRNHFYPGTLYQTNFGESLPKGFVEFQAAVKGDKIQFKHRFIGNDPAFKLINLRVFKRRHLDAIDPNPLYRYKLFVSEDVRLTEQDLAAHHNIVNRLSFTDEKELELLEEDEFQLDHVKVDLSYDKALNDFLKGRKLTRSQIERCRQILDLRKDVPRG
jgi:DNA repair exonuclease SbcCD nuclease subunit